jgi:hypothetical protein
MNVSFRILNIVGNELVVYWIILSTDLGEQGGLGLTINFASSMLICELDDIIFETGRIHNLKERFDDLAGSETENGPSV